MSAVPAASRGAPDEDRPGGFRRVATWLAERGHPHQPRWLAVSARTCAEAAEAADALGVQAGQIAKSVRFRRRSDGVAVLVNGVMDKAVPA